MTSPRPDELSISLKPKSTWVGIVAGFALAIASACILCSTYFALQTPVKEVFRFIVETIQGPTSHQSLLSLAEKAISDDRPEEVKNILLIQISDWDDSSELAKAFRLLAKAEMMQGHFILAAMYYEKLHVYEPTIENLYESAVLYDMGGYLDLAYQKFLMVYKSRDPEARTYRYQVEKRLADITAVLKSRYNGVLPTPFPTYTPAPGN